MVSVDGLQMATAERTALADRLETLTPEQWQAQSLCDDWLFATWSLM